MFVEHILMLLNLVVTCNVAISCVKGLLIYLHTYIDKDFSISICKADNSSLNILVEGTRAMQVGKLLKERNIPFEVSATDCMATPVQRIRSPSVTLSSKNKVTICTISICKADNSSLNILVEGTRAMQVGKLLKERNIPFEVSATDCMATPVQRIRSPSVTLSSKNKVTICTLSICKADNSSLNILVEGTRAMQVGKLLKERNIPFEVSATDCMATPVQRIRSPSVTLSSKNKVTICTISICKADNSSLNILVEGTRAMQVGKLLKERNIPFEVSATDCMATPVQRIRSPSVTLSSKNKVTICRQLDWKDFYPLPIVYNFMDSLESEFPSKCTVNVIGRTVEGRDIKMLKISNSAASNCGVWLDGCIHAREWITVSVVCYIADFIARNFDTLPLNITNKDWYIVPVVNPDGYIHSHTHDRMWRKSRARHLNTVVGVDLNRNFGFGLNPPSEGASSDPYHINYRGPEPFSEPESSAVKDIILYSGIPFKMFLSFHAYSEVIAFPWCCSSDPCPDYVSLLEGGTIMSKAIYKSSGRMYKVGAFKDLMYYANGTSIDWSYGTAHIPFSYLIELRSKQHKFLLPKEEIIECCKEVLSGLQALTVYVDKQKCLNYTILSKRG